MKKIIVLAMALGLISGAVEPRFISSVAEAVPKEKPNPAPNLKGKKKKKTELTNNTTDVEEMLTGNIFKLIRSEPDEKILAANISYVYRDLVNEWRKYLIYRETKKLVQLDKETSTKYVKVYVRDGEIWGTIIFPEYNSYYFSINLTKEEPTGKFARYENGFNKGHSRRWNIVF